MHIMYSDGVAAARTQS